MVSAVILNYLNPELTVKAVDHLTTAASATDIAVEVIVVDNSAPKTAIALRNTLPADVKIIENEENKGFSVANNQGIKHAEGDVILVMNNDLFINEKVLKNGVELVTSNKKCGIWAPKLTDQFDNAQRSCAHFPTLKGVISEYLMNQPLENKVALQANEGDQTIQVDTVIGACMLIRKEVLQEVGLFDEDYFFNSEDVDLCYKIKQAGYEILFDPRCEAIHLYSASQDSAWCDNDYLHDARKLYFKKHHKLITALLAQVFIDTGILLRKIKHKFN